MNPQAYALSVVIPVYRGAHFLGALFDELTELRDWFRDNHAPVELSEVIFVDDDSQDGSLALLQNIAQEHPWVRVLQLSRNFGQHPTTAAGILHSSGDWVCTLDEDLQHRPADIPKLLYRATSGKYDICYAKSPQGTHGPFRNASSKLAKKLIAKLSGNRSINLFNSFRLIRGPIARAASAVVAHKTYLDIALSWYTTRACTQYLDMQDPRHSANSPSGYRLSSLIRHAARLFQSVEVRALKYAALAGITLMGLAFLLGTYVLGIKIWQPDSIAMPGWTSVLLTTVFFGGTSAFFAGLMLDQMYFTSQKLHGRPVYFVTDRSHDEVIADWLSANKYEP